MKKSEGSSPPFRIHFYARGTVPSKIANDTIVITPSPDSWNDFGKRILVEIRVKFSDQVSSFFSTAFLGFIEDSSSSFGTERFEDALQGRSPVPSEDLKFRFFTMLPSMDDYRQAVESLGVDRAKFLLLSINDIVAANELQKSASWLVDAESSAVFSLSFMRTSQSYFTHKNAGSILNGLQHEALGSLSQSLQVKFKLAGPVNPYHLRFDFDHKSELPKRIAVVIGKNGVGKSQTLSHIARAATEGSTSILQDGNGERANISRVLAFAPTNEAESVFPAERPKSQKIWYRRFSINRSRRARKGEYISDLILQVARSESRIKTRSRWNIFLEALKALNAPQTICLLNKAGGNIRLDTLHQGTEQALLERYASLDLTKEPVRAHGIGSYPLSSGEISFVKFAAQLCLNIENGTLVLLDEPETHLHPNFISRFVSLLDSVLDITGSSAIIATHSVYFVKEVFKEQVTVLRLHDFELQVEKPFMQTFGADVGAISYFVFGEDEPTRLALKLENELIDKYQSWEAVADRFRGELSIDYLNDLRSKIESRP